MSRIRSLPVTEWPEESKSSGARYHFYVVQEGDDGPVKIGIARNAFWRRSDLQTGNPRKIFLRAIYECEGRSTALILEAAVLLEFADQRILGEWISAPLAAMVKFVELQVRQCLE